MCKGCLKDQVKSSLYCPVPVCVRRPKVCTGSWETASRVKKVKTGAPP